MDFFAHQEAARKRTKLLLLYYGVAVAMLVLSTYAAVMIVFIGTQHNDRRTRQSQPPAIGAPALWNPRIFAGATIGTLMVIGLGTMWRVIQLRGGGSAVAEMLGGRPVEVDPTDERERQLRNVIEEMAIASGTPVPQIYLLEHEAAVNAFAAGHSGNDMAVGVTRGCMERLSRDELQGVIGHEFSHMLNGDTRLNIRLLGVLNGILCIYIIGRILLQTRSNSRKGNNALPLFGLALVAIGGLGVLFAHLIQAAVSRQREFLADASAVQFTRNPNGISGALKKIGGLSLGSKLETAHADSASHFFFANGLSESWFNLTATHPPLAERIRRIDPSFDGQFPAVPDMEMPLAPRTTSGAMPYREAAVAGFATAPERRVNSQFVIQSVGKSLPVQYASGVIQALPESLRAATRDAWTACSLLLATVLSAVPEVRERQRRMLEAGDPRFAKEADRLADELAQCDRRARLPLISLSLPALRTLSGEQWQRVAALLDRLVCCDGQIELYEFVVKKIVARQMDARYAPKSVAAVQYYSFAPLARDCATLISALANVGAQDEGTTCAAFEKGFSQLPFSSTPKLVDRSECGVQQIDAALTRLGQAVPYIKKAVMQACAETVASDGTVTADEAELLRAVADSLGCPVPPLIRGV